MKLILKRIAAPIMPSGLGFVLADESGEPLPMQTRLVLAQQVGELQEVTVTFLIDGRDIRIEEAQGETCPS